MNNKIKELREEINNKLDALELEIINERIDGITKKNPLIPGLEQKYWCIDGNYLSGYCFVHWKNDEVDKNNLAMGNVFLTEQAVKNEIAKRKAIQTIKMYIAENFLFEADWSDINQSKYSIRYNSECENYEIQFEHHIQMQSQIGFLKSIEDCQEIISKFKNELDIIFSLTTKCKKCFGEGQIDGVECDECN